MIKTSKLMNLTGKVVQKLPGVDIPHLDIAIFSATNQLGAISASTQIQI